MEVSTIIASAAVVIALFSLYVSWRYSRRSLYLQAFENVIERWQCDEMMKYRKVVAEEVKWIKDRKKIFPINHPPSEHERFRDAMRNVSHFFDSLGVRVKHKYIDRKLIYPSLGGTIINHWEILGPYILKEREWLKQNEEPWYHQLYFEWLFKDAQKFNPERHLPRID